MNDNYWLRNLPHTYFNVHFTNATLDNSITIQQLNIIGNTSKSHINIDQFNITSNLLDAQLQLKASLQLFRPTFNGVLNINKLDLNYINNLISPLEQMENYKNAILKQTTVDSTNFILGEDVINLFGINNYDGNIDLYIQNCYNPNISQISANIDLKSGILFIKNLQMNVNNGQVKAEAYVIASSMAYYNTVFSLYNINPNELFQAITGIDEIDGIMSIVGTMNSQGNTMTALISNSTGTINFIGKQMTIQGFNMNALVQLADSNSDTRNQIEYYSNNESTLFNTISGSINIKQGIAELNNINFNNKRINGLYNAYYNLYNKEFKSIGVFAFSTNTSPVTMQLNLEGILPNTIHKKLEIQNMKPFYKQA
jgi:hypothetical protein